MGHKNDAALLIRKAAQFAAGFAGGGGTAGGVATAGTTAQISPMLGARVRGGFSAISPGFREFEESRARIGRSSAETNRLQEQTRQLRLAEEQRQKPVNLRNLTGGFITQRSQQKLEQALLAQGADIDGNGIISQGELERALPKLDKRLIIDTIGEDIAEFSKNITQNETNVQTLIDQANKKMLGSGTTITKQDFQTNPELGRTFPKIAEAITRQDSAQNKIDVLTSKQTSIKDVLKREAKAPTVPKLTGLTKTFDNFGIDISDPNQIAAITDDEWEALAAQIDSTGELSGEVLKQLVFRNFAGGAPIVTGGSENVQTSGTDPLGLRQ